MPEFDPELKPSKSAAKRAHKELQKKIELLCKQPEVKLRALPLPEIILDELLIAQSMKPSSAKNRQIRHIASMLAKQDDDVLSQIGLKLEHAKN